MSDGEQVRFDGSLRLAAGGGRIYEGVLIAAGELVGHDLSVSVDVLRAALPLFGGVSCLLNHAGWLESGRVEMLIGVWQRVRVEGEAVVGELVLKATPAAEVARDLLDELVADQDAGRAALDVGVSLSCWIARDGDQITALLGVESADLVFRPASAAARITRILASAGPVPASLQEAQEVIMSDEEKRAGEYVQALAQTTLVARLAASDLPGPAREMIERRFVGAAPTVAEIDRAVDEQRALIAALAPKVSGHDRPHVQQMSTSGDQAQEIVDWLFGVAGAKAPEPSMRRPSNFYRALTGDHNWHGRYVWDRSQFAAGSVANLADLAANAMNKVLVEQWPAVQAYRWFEELVTVAPNDGSVNAMSWTTFGGIANLPTVAEGAAYTEATVADAHESDAFAKYGIYVGITEEMFRNDNLAALQSIPRALAVAAVRTRSANFAGIFTQASGTGPTLDQDSTVLFHSNHGSNVQTTALSAAGWKAARLECFKHAELGSSKRLGLYPKYCLIPADLFDDALVYFGYGSGLGGYPGTANNDTNPYGVTRDPADPRPVPIVVPDWTDTNDWAYLVDPRLHPVLMVSYAQSPGGRVHALPEIFSVSNPTAGLVFSNDTLPVKVRDWYSFGVAGWRGIGKRNVT